MKFTLTVNNNDGKSFFGDEKALSVQKQDEKRIFAVFANVSISEGSLKSDEGVTCLFDELPQGRYLCDYMDSNYWSAPFFGKDYTKVPGKTQAILIEDEDGYLCILPLVGERYRTYLTGSEKGLKSITYADCDGLQECRDPLFIYGYGKDLYALLKDVFAYASQTLGGKFLLREDRVYPKSLETLGWCTWDAMHIHVSQQGVWEKCAEFQRKGVPVKWMILDDMWADCPHLNEIPEDMDFLDMIKEMHQTKMRSFTADKKRFPNGLQGCIEKTETFGIKTAVWFPAMGYWRGYEPDCALVQENPDDFITNKNGIVMVKPTKEHFKKIYSQFTKYIKDCGGAFVKIDMQSCLGMYEGVYPIGERAKALQTAIEEVANEQFGGEIIHCMGMSSENMFNRHKTAVIRCSNDFLPNDSAWFTKHINHCAYNTLFWGNVYYTDWDMFWTNDGQAKKNAVLHALCGGPVYISDKIGETVPEVLAPICKENGEIIRAEEPLVPVRELVFVDASKEKTPISLFNRKHGAVALASFNIYGNEPVIGEIDLSQFAFRSEKVCVYDWFEKTAQILDKGAKLQVKVRETDEIRLSIVSEIKDGVALIGDPTKYLSPYNVKRTSDNVVLVSGGDCVIVSEEKLNITGGISVEKQGNVYLCKTAGKTQLKVEVLK